MKILHIESFVSTNGKLVYIERMRSKFLTFVDEAIDPLNFKVSKIQELLAVDVVIIKETKKYKYRLAKMDELIDMHDYWMVWDDKIIIPNDEEINNVTGIMK